MINKDTVCVMDLAMCMDENSNCVCFGVSFSSDCNLVTTALMEYRIPIIL